MPDLIPYILLGILGVALLFFFGMMMFMLWVSTTRANISIGIYANDRFSDKRILEWLEWHFRRMP